jgi:hypothetical protein
VTSGKLGSLSSCSASPCPPVQQGRHVSCVRLLSLLKPTTCHTRCGFRWGSTHEGFQLSTTVKHCITALCNHCLTCWTRLSLEPRGRLWSPRRVLRDACANLWSPDARGGHCWGDRGTLPGCSAQHPSRAHSSFCSAQGARAGRMGGANYEKVFINTKKCVSFSTGPSTDSAGSGCGIRWTGAWPH